MVEGKFVVVGAAPNPGGAPFALLAREAGGELVYAGSAFVTLPGASRDRFWRTIEPRRTPSSRLIKTRAGRKLPPPRASRPEVNR